MHDGWFTGSDDGEGDMARYAEAFARRGYVALTVEYRSRPDLDCCPTDDAIAVTDAILDGRDDAAAALEWLHEHADQYRIDHEAVAVGGAAAGATNSFGLAYPPDGTGGHEPPPHHTPARHRATVGRLPRRHGARAAGLLRPRRGAADHHHAHDRTDGLDGAHVATDHGRGGPSRWQPAADGIRRHDDAGAHRPGAGGAGCGAAAGSAPAAVAAGS